MNEWYGKVQSYWEKRVVLPFVPKYSTAPEWTIPTRVPVEIVSAQDPMLDFSIVLLTEQNPESW